MKSKTLLFIALLIFSTNAARGQKHEIAFTSGGLKVGERGFNLPQPGFLKFKTGFTYQFNYAQRLVDAKIASLYWEVPFAVTPKTKVTGTNALSPNSYSSLFFSPGLKVKLFPIGRYSPYGAIGFNVSRFNQGSTLINNQPNANRESDTTAGLTIAGGLDVKVISKLSIRGEVRDFYAEVPPLNINALRNRQHNALISAGVVVRF
jgi:opacity protein-like surface antigen